MKIDVSFCLNPRQVERPDGGFSLVHLDPEDAASLKARSIYLGMNGYAYFSTWAGGPQTVHAFVMGGARDGLHIDHVNGNKLDNRKRNLRFVTPQKNQVNRKRRNKNNTSGVRGITVRPGTRNPYIAQIYVAGRSIYLGSHAELRTAVDSRKAAEVQYFGEVCP